MPKARPIPLTVEVRRAFLNRASIGGRDVCWNWQGALTGKGYGFIKQKVGTFPAHRVGYEVANPRQLPETHDLHHTCFNPRCVNPHHLEPHLPGDHSRQHRTDLCRRGHPLTEDNVLIEVNGDRRCKTCRRDYYRLRALEEK